ncbi:MAG: hypothetical protein K0Q87_153 [Neobacillus sp.]|nr:hypothetical protein [Neobacillus sp.]
MTIPLLIVICFGLFLWSVYSSFELSDTQKKVEKQNRTIQHLNKVKKSRLTAVPIQGETKTQPYEPSHVKVEDRLEKQIEKDRVLTNNFFNSLYTYTNKTFPQRYKKASRYCTNSVLMNLIGTGSGNDGDVKGGGQPPSLVKNSSKSKEQVVMKVEHADLYINTSNLNITTGLVKVVYDLWINNELSGESTSWYNISIDTQQNKINKLSLVELDG